MHYYGEGKIIAFHGHQSMSGGIIFPLLFTFNFALLYFEKQTEIILVTGKEQFKLSKPPLLGWLITVHLKPRPNKCNTIQHFWIQLCCMVLDCVAKRMQHVVWCRLKLWRLEIWDELWSQILGQSTCCPCLREDLLHVHKCNNAEVHIIQPQATWWPNKFNMLHITMLNDVKSWCCICLAKALKYSCSCQYSKFQFIN